MFATILVDEADEYPYLLDIGSPGPLGQRRVASDALFARLSADTTGALPQSSDDTHDEGEVNYRPASSAPA